MTVGPSMRSAAYGTVRQIFGQLLRIRDYKQRITVSVVIDPVSPYGGRTAKNP